MNKKEKYRRAGMLALFIGLAIISITLLILPADFFDGRQSICLSVVLFNKQCGGCGMTRAIQHLIHLDIKAAWGYNKLSVIVFPLLVGMILWELNKFYKSLRAEKKE